MLDTTKLELKNAEFKKFRDLMYVKTGVNLTDDKLLMVKSRLAKRLRLLGLNSFQSYLAILENKNQDEELQQFIDVLTTNETSFFRESHHFKTLSEYAEKIDYSMPIRVWSAASSSGEEPYSIAMTLANCRLNPAWELIASDINKEVLAKASQGLYDLTLTKQIPTDFLAKFCLKGVRSHQDQFLFNEKLKQHMVFMQINLNEFLPAIGQFHFIFLRNVMIYFNDETRRKIIQRMIERLVVGGLLFIGHSESIRDFDGKLKLIGQTTYQKVS